MSEYKRINNGLYSVEFIERFKGSKLLLYPTQMGVPSVAPQDKDCLFHGLNYEWEYTSIAEIDLGDGNNVSTGRDGDFVRLYNKHCSVFLGGSLSGYVVLDLADL